MPKPPADIVNDFYAAITDADPDALADIVGTHFADDAAVEWPPSLPHGGRVEGSRRLRALFTGIAKPGATVGMTNLKLTRTIGSDNDVVACLTFDWRKPGAAAGIPNKALEQWTFEGGKVKAIHAYYWDSAAITDGARA